LRLIERERERRGRRRNLWSYLYFISQLIIILPMCMQMKNMHTNFNIFHCVDNFQINKKVMVMSVYKFWWTFNMYYIHHRNFKFFTVSKGLYEQNETTTTLTLPLLECFWPIIYEGHTPQKGIAVWIELI
jgi:hypothetical protein